MLVFVFVGVCFWICVCVFGNVCFCDLVWHMVSTEQSAAYIIGPKGKYRKIVEEIFGTVTLTIDAAQQPVSRLLDGQETSDGEMNNTHEIFSWKTCMGDPFWEIWTLIIKEEQ